MRRSSAGLDGQSVKTAVPVRANFQDIKQHLKHLGPSNPATNPNKTRSTTVKIKPGSGAQPAHARSGSATEPATEDVPTEEGDETTSLLKPQITGKDGVQALRQSYGSTSPGITVQVVPPSIDIPADSGSEGVDKSTQTPIEPSFLDQEAEEPSQPHLWQSRGQPSPPLPRQPRSSSSAESGAGEENTRTDTILSLGRPYVRSGSITENIVESRGVRKVVLETTSSAEDEEAVGQGSSSPEQQPSHSVTRAPFGLFSRDGRSSSKDKADDRNPVSQPSQEGEDEDDELLSPGPEDDEDGPESYAEAAAQGTQQEGEAGGASGGAGKKKNRRKKRKGGKS